ncbi:TPA: ribose 5-phosphate isomerase B, partial [Pasteurella multocida]|nr:ribose 5-phosphate isomerase B [Pasteurella multocida]HDR1849858.1 ribose 5-phosphate isomerase B [Pasteurella multocida]
HKNFLIDKLKKQGHILFDKGTFTDKRTDYPIYAKAVADSVIIEESEFGILICGTGVGISIAANKIKGIRCALCSDEFTALMCREHNDTNIISFGANIITPEKALALVTLWINTPYDAGRHQRRLEMIDKLEQM